LKEKQREEKSKILRDHALEKESQRLVVCTTICQNRGPIRESLLYNFGLNKLAVEHICMEWIYKK
jgi:hypothetical protein